MRRSGKNSERAEEVRGDKKKPAKVEPLRPQAEHTRKLPNDLAKFPEENPYPVLRIHKNGTVLYANKASEPILKAKKSGVGLPAPSEWRRLVEEVLVSGCVVREEVKDNGRVFAFRVVPIADSDYVNFYGADITERKKAEERLKAERQRLYDVLETLPVMVCLLTPDYHVTFANCRFRQKFGEDNGRPCFDYIFGRKGPCEFCEAHNVLKTGKPHHWECTGPDGCSIIDVYDFPFTDTDGSPLILEMDIDITERKQAEEEREVMIKLLRLINTSNQMHELMMLVAQFLKDWSRCEAIGIRLQEGEDFPYFVTSGFSEEFILAENKLCSVNEIGELVRDKNGKPFLECMCGNIISSRFDPSKPFFTEHGSFWTNSTTDLLAGTTKADRLAKTRNRCNTAGYESVALIPLRLCGETFGLLQFNSKQRGRFTPERISLFEKLADNLAIGLAQRRADNALRESETRFRTLADESFDSIAIHDGQGIIEVNKAFGRLWGYDPREAVGMKIDKFFAPECWEDAKKRIQSGYDRPYEADTIRKDGTRFQVEIAGKSIIYKGKPARIATARDITERKRAEEELRKSDKSYRVTFENTGTATVLIEDDTTISLANTEFERLSGFSKQEIEGRKKWTEFVVKEDLVWMLEQHRLRRENKEAAMKQYEFRFVTKSGDIRDISLLIDVIPGTKRSVASLMDITARKQAECALRASEDRFRSLFEQAADAIVVIDTRTGEMAEFNERAHQMLGYTRAEYAKLRLSDIEAIESKEEVAAHIDKIVRQGSDIFEARQRKKDGTLRDVLVSSKLTTVAGKPYLQAIWRDITEIKKADAKLLEYQKQLKQLASQLALTEERERRRIAGELHDQLCQSLALVKIRLDAIRSSGKSKPAEEELMQVSDAMQRLIDQTRLLVFDLSSPILYELGFEAAVAEWLNEQVHDKGSIETEFQDDHLPKPLDDNVRVLLFRNVRELLINVIKHSRASKVKVCIRRVDDSIEITVEDNGVGFNPAEAKTIAAKTAKFGLFSIRESVEQLGGHFEIESKPDAGCKATIAAPLKGKGCQKEE